MSHLDVRCAFIFASVCSLMRSPCADQVDLQLSEDVVQSCRFVSSGFCVVMDAYTVVAGYFCRRTPQSLLWPALGQKGSHCLSLMVSPAPVSFRTVHSACDWWFDRHEARRDSELVLNAKAERVLFR